MFGLDDLIVHLSSGASIGVVLLVAALLGLRHATDPDHIAAVTTLVASRQHSNRAAARLGAFWGLGHALTLVLFGLPILLFQEYLPGRLQQGAETAVAALIVFLALRLLVRWRHGFFSLHAHPHEHEHHHHRVRTPLGAFGIGLVHGIGGSAGVGVLLLAAIPSTPVAVGSLLVLARVHRGLDDARDDRLRSHARVATRGRGVQRRGSRDRRREPRLRALVRGRRVEPRRVPVLTRRSLGRLCSWRRTRRRRRPVSDHSHDEPHTHAHRTRTARRTLTTTSTSRSEPTIRTHEHTHADGTTHSHDHSDHDHDHGKRPGFLARLFGAK